MRKIGLILFILSSQMGLAQENLVPNPSFEEHIGCSNDAGWIWAAPPWNDVSGNCDYFNECDINGYGIPVSIGGGGARTGQAYAQFSMWAVAIHNGYEHLGVELTSSLNNGAKYNVEFYISLMDSA